MAKLLVPSGGLAQDNAGDMFSPTQFGLDLLLPAFFTASRSPSLKLGDDSVNAPCALACCVPQDRASARAPATIEPRKSMTTPSDLVDDFSAIPASGQITRL